jgi:hypothetical protein
VDVNGRRGMDVNGRGDVNGSAAGYALTPSSREVLERVRQKTPRSTEGLGWAMTAGAYTRPLSGLTSALFAGYGG